MRWSEAGYLLQIMLSHALCQVSVSLILGVRRKNKPTCNGANESIGGAAQAALRQTRHVLRFRGRNMIAFRMDAGRMTFRIRSATTAESREAEFIL
jgi:hypothetical protein